MDTRGRRPSRRLMGVAGVALGALLAGIAAVVVVVGRHSTPATTAAVTLSGVSSENQLDNLIRTHEVTAQLAEAQFALDVGPLPGVSVRGIKPDHGFDGTVATLDLYAVWSSLTAAQQRAATRLLASPNLATLTSAASTSPFGAQPEAQLMGLESDYRALAEQANTEEATESGAPPYPGFVINISYDFPLAYAVSDVFYKKGKGPWQQYTDGCHITVFQQGFEKVDATTAAALIAHEVWHCFQQRQAGSGAAFVSINKWITEGEATWVMDQLYPANGYTPPIWTIYASTPVTVFAARSYDAVGVFGHQGDVAGGQGSVWPDLLPVVSAGIGGQDGAALQRLMGSDSDRFYSAWGASYFEDQTHIDWHMAGPGDPPKGALVGPGTVFMGNGDAQETGIRSAYQSQETTINGNADILIVTLASGYGEVHDSAYEVQQTLDTSAPLSLCMKDTGCKCPDGSPGASLQTIPAQWPVSVGVNGGDTDLAAYARGDSLARYCQKPDQSPPSVSGPGPGGSGGPGDVGTPAPPVPAPTGMSMGDPHYFTFDGRTYDMQAAGEFTLVQSTTDDFTVQTRTVPLPASQRPVAVNAAIAVRFDGHRVTFTLENGVVVLRVDGVVDDYVQQTVGGGSVTRLGTEVGTGFVVDLSDGTTVRIDQGGTYALNVTVRVAADRMGKLTGLLGNDDGSASTDFVTPEGVSLGSSPSTAILDVQYADACITQARSLFDYLPGQSTATFTNRSFPASYVDATTIPGAAQAQQRCAADDITDPHLLADCVVDASSIPDQTVLTTYAQAQVVQTVQYNVAHNLPPFAPPSGPGAGGATGSPTPASTATPNLQGVLLDIGRVNDPSETQTFTFAGMAGEIIWIGAPACDDGGLTFALIDPQGNTMTASAVSQSLPACSVGLGRSVLPSTGTYQLVANANHKLSGNYSLPIRVERPDDVRAISIGEAVAGEIPDAAAHDVYTLQAHAGEIVEIGGSGCIVSQPNNPIGVQVLSVHDIPAGAPGAGNKDGRVIDCGDPFQFQLNDTYQITVNWVNVGPFSYRFTLLQQQQ